MVEVNMLYNYVKEGKSFRAKFQAAEMYAAVEMLNKINEVLYDEGYHTSNVNIEEVLPV